jgi:hypothetical protein
MQQYYKRENGERARESEEKFGQHGVAIKLHVQMRRGGFILRERGRGDPPCMLSKCHSQKREAHSRGRGGEERRGGHHERGELPLGEETQKWGKGGEGEPI